MRNRILFSCLILSITPLASCEKKAGSASISLSHKTSSSGGVCLSFDDRNINEWYSMRPLLNRYNAKVTFFVTQFDSLTTDELEKLKDLKSDGHEIAAHGELHVNAEFFIKDHSYKQYLKDEIDAEISSMTNKGFKPTSFAYPYGAKYWFIDFLLLKRFNILRGVADPPHNIDISKFDPIFYRKNKGHLVFAAGIDKISNLSKDGINNAFNRCIIKDEIVLFYGHLPQEKARPKSYEFDISLLEYILKAAEKKKLQFVTVGDLNDLH